MLYHSKGKLGRVLAMLPATIALLAVEVFSAYGIH